VKINPHFGLYAVLTNPLIGYERMTEILVRREVNFVQLRMKEEPEDLVRATAARLRTITAGTPTRFIVNDFPRIAAEVGADGVHVGQDDTPCSQVRDIVGDNAIVGISTHNPAQVRDACALHPDYIGIGPVYATTTKAVPDPVLGIQGMKAMLAEATVPAVVLGGIDLERLPDVLRAGAVNFCMVRPLMRAERPDELLRRISEIRARYTP